jgi:hypothetical protein
MRGLVARSFAGLFIVVAACGGRVATSDSNGSTNGNGTQSGSQNGAAGSQDGSQNGGAASGSGTSSPLPPSAGPAPSSSSGAGPSPGGGSAGCSMEPPIGTIGDGPICSVAVGLMGDPNDPTLTMDKGDEGSATQDGATMILTCSRGGSTLMSATIDCYAGAGHYTIPAGSLTLGPDFSDRSCTVDVDIENGNDVRGFISCDPGGDEKSLFAHTQPPIGLGTYSLPLTTK